MRISAWGSVKARKPRSCNSRLPGGNGYGVASAMRLSWTQPPWVSLRKRMVRGALTSRTFLDRKSTRLNSSHLVISYGVFCLKKKIGEKRGPRKGVAGLLAAGDRRVEQGGRRGAEQAAGQGVRHFVPWRRGSGGRPAGPYTVR